VEQRLGRLADGLERDHGPSEAVESMVALRRSR
jgi:hypothetical protein